MRLVVTLLFLAVSTCCFAQDPHYKAASERMHSVQQRLKVKRTDFGELGVKFYVWVSPPAKASFDPTKYKGLSEFARAIDLPCQRVQVGLNSFSPTGKKDLSLSLGLNLGPDGSLSTEFHLPKSHSGSDVGGHPYLVLVCSHIYKNDGAIEDWIPVVLSLQNEPPNKAL